MEQVLAVVKFDGDGLVTAIAQQRDTGEVLMVAYMNRDSLVETLETGRVTYWSRSRQELWRKGATSGQVQKLVEARVDCDGDAILLLVEQTGVACHTGRRTCFYRQIGGDGVTDLVGPETDPARLYGPGGDRDGR